MKNRERIEQLESWRDSAQKRLTYLETRAILKPEYDPADVAFNRAKPWQWSQTTAEQPTPRQWPATPVDDTAELRAENARLAAERDAHGDRDMLLAEWNKAAAERDDLRGAMAAQDGRERAAGEKCGVPYDIHGCDWPDAVAEEVNRLRSELKYCNSMNASLTTVSNYERDRANETVNALHAALAERDALRARIDGGTVVYGECLYEDEDDAHWQWSNIQGDCDTKQARLIDIAPIAIEGIKDLEAFQPCGDHCHEADQRDHYETPEEDIAPLSNAGDVDERKGERRKGLEICLAGRFKRTDDSRYYQGDRRHPNDRRRTPGTRADRKAGSNE